MSTNTEPLEHFEGELLDWARSACESFGYPDPDDAWIDDVYQRLPEGLRATLGRELLAGEIRTVDGFKFTFNDFPSGKGPYTWLERDSARQQPRPTWEYLIQVPEFLRLRRVGRSAGLEVRFEDRLMDVTVLDGADLVLYCEVKETAAQIDNLLRGMAAHAASIDFDRADRGNEPLRTAKRLMAFRPQFLSLLGLGKRYEFRVEYPTDRSFHLHEDLPGL